MPHLLNVWPRVSRRLLRAPRTLLLLDYDGTLCPIASRPELAILPPRTRDSLVALTRKQRLSLGIVSGRALSDVRAKLNIPELIYAGNHGMEIKGPGLEFAHPEAEAIRPEMDVLLKELEANLSQYNGVLVEGKGFTLSVHYRLTPEDVRPLVFEGFERTLEKVERAESFRVTRGKEVLEARPNVDWHKGRAIEKIMESMPAGTLPVFFGDDLTDEDGFAAVQELNGICVFVGPPRQPTRAIYRVDSPQEVTQTLELIARLFPRPGNRYN